MKALLTLIILPIIIYSCNNTVKSKTDPIDSASEKNLIAKQPDTTKKTDTTFAKKAALQVDSKLKNPFSKMIMIASGQISPYKEIKIQGINFNLVLDGADTTYLATTEESFTTPEGLSVGMQLSELPTDIQKDLTKEPGWAYYYKLPSKWSLGFCEGPSCTDNYPTSHSKVKWIFKRQ
jgi:hypothetical protein